MPAPTRYDGTYGGRPLILHLSFPPAADVAACPTPAARSGKDRVRLMMLYALRFESDTQRVSSLQEALAQLGIKAMHPQLYAAAEGLQRYAGADK